MIIAHEELQARTLSSHLKMQAPAAEHIPLLCQPINTHVTTYKEFSLLQLTSQGFGHLKTEDNILTSQGDFRFFGRRKGFLEILEGFLISQEPQEPKLVIIFGYNLHILLCRLVHILALIR